MPHILAPFISKRMPGLWGEGHPYSSEVIYDICSTDSSVPPIHYEEHSIKPHSICHFDAPGHIIPGGKKIDELITGMPDFFYGAVTVIRIPRPNFSPHLLNPLTKQYEITVDDILTAMGMPSKIPSFNKLLVTFEGATPDFYASTEYALTLSLEAARWLTSLKNFNLFGTPWKSVDFQPNSRERPIHTELFKSAGILECLDLTKVPQGEYFLSAFPLPLMNATESPVCPVLFTRNEICW